MKTWLKGPHRQRLSREVPWQFVSQPDDRRSRPLGDNQGHAARDGCPTVEHARACAGKNDGPTMIGRRRISMSLSLSRRTFLTGAGAVVASDVIRRSHANVNTDEEAGMEITRIGSQPSAKGPGDWFTGAVRIDRLFQPHTPARAAGASVTFEPGARTAWHTHPLGQTLIITAGCGWVQRDGGPVEEVHPGDVVWFPPGEKHWHGATATMGMTHIAIQEQLDGKVVDWLEHVSEEQYRK
jgi:quercetin dioxygenase-like cupin family protein